MTPPANTQQDHSYIIINDFQSEHLCSNGTCLVPDQVDFLYIMRRDTDFVTNKLFSKNADKSFMTSLYDNYIDNLAGVLTKHFAHLGTVSIHCLGSEFLEQAQRQSIQPNDVTVSLDPLLTGDNIVSLGVSRHYYPGGEEGKAIAARPGHPPLHEQISALSQYAHVTVFEDDIFSGSSIVGIAKQMKSAGATMGRVVPGIQVGEPQALTDHAIVCHPVLKYISQERSLDNRVDLGDPRDFLLGADGLVIDFGTGSSSVLGRAPYILPFTSPTARLGIPESQELEFSKDILSLNIAFYNNLAEQHGHVVTLGDTDMYFQETMHQYGMPVSNETSMADVSQHIYDHLEPLRQKTSVLYGVARGPQHG